MIVPTPVLAWWSLGLEVLERKRIQRDWNWSRIDSVWRTFKNNHNWKASFFFVQCVVETMWNKSLLKQDQYLSACLSVTRDYSEAAGVIVTKFCETMWSMSLYENWMKHTELCTQNVSPKKWNMSHSLNLSNEKSEKKISVMYVPQI